MLTCKSCVSGLEQDENIECLCASLELPDMEALCGQIAALDVCKRPALIKVRACAHGWMPYVG